MAAAVWFELASYLTPAEFKKGLSIKVAYVLLHQADILLTTFAMSAGFREINPIIRGMLDTPMQLLLIKLLIPVLIAWIVPAKLLLPALALLLLVIGLNLWQLSSLL
jgi:hypothetical protein